MHTHTFTRDFIQGEPPTQKDVAICGVVLPRPMPITGVNEIWSAAYTWGFIQIQRPILRFLVLFLFLNILDFPGYGPPH